MEPSRTPALSWERESLLGSSLHSGAEAASAAAAFWAACIAVAAVRFFRAGVNLESLRLASRAMDKQERVLRNSDVCSRVSLSIWTGESTNRTRRSSTRYLLLGYFVDGGENCAKELHNSSSSTGLVSGAK